MAKRKRQPVGYSLEGDWRAGPRPFINGVATLQLDLTYHPPDDMPGTRVIFQRYHNSHVVLDALPEIDCFGVISPVDRDRLWPGESGPVTIYLRISMEAGPWMESALDVGKGFTIDEFGYFIATGIITALLSPLTPTTP